MAYTTDVLIADIQRNGLFPSNQQTFLTADFVAMMNEELQSVVVPKILSARENYLLTTYDYPVLNPNQANYPIPPDAIGGMIKELQRIDASGNPYKLPRLEIAQIASSVGVPQSGFYIQNNQAIMYPNNPTVLNTTQTVRFLYYRRPNDLCAITEAGQITAIPDAYHLTLTSVPTDWVVGTSVCVIGQNPSFDTEVLSATITGISGNTLAFSAGLTTLAYETVSVGDWVALQGQSPIPQISPEAHRLLVQSTVAKVLMAQGDQAGAQLAQQKYSQIEDFFINHIINPRIEDSPKKITTGGRGIGDSRYRGIYRIGWR